ncbi:HD-GYP domain-containing protein [Azospirillum thermophilum]|uniref:HD-GYP domain-containing protein n=1 Tax=Azospirillum thermophilum TaxID=2202148 RepID=A0A2S2CY88_9PROT|nr:HD domain-containing phosphohydrolase [Azospirillum thermophilum]AWK89483.1 hypothetical protein DEW08_26025 [Azospirillum thermophilum]
MTIDTGDFLTRLRRLFRLRVHDATRAVEDLERDTILCLSRAAEHRDPETGNHLARMASYSRLIAEGIGRPAGEVRLIHAAAPMHDVGKIGIPDSVLLKPGPLTQEEVAVMRQHTVYGYEILAGSSSPLLTVAAEIALTHHEQFDGSGYPQGLAGTEIPLVGRITALADVFDALTSVRPYKPAWPLATARRHIVEHSGSHFDPDCVQVLVERWDEVCGIAGAYADADADAGMVSG